MMALLFSIVTLAGALGAAFFRHLLYSVLALLVAMTGLAGLAISLGFDFIGWAQLWIGVGAVGVAFLFVLMLTRGDPSEAESGRSASGSWGGWAVVGILFAFWVAKLRSGLYFWLWNDSRVTTEEIGRRLVQQEAIVLIAFAVFLTAALVGVVALCSKEEES